MADPTTQAATLDTSEQATGADAKPPLTRRARVVTRAIDWRPIVLEAFFVVLGVVLALAANAWRQALIDRRAASTALESIREELGANRQAVLRSLQYHLHLSDTLGLILRQTAAQRDSAPLPGIRVFAQGFVHPAQLLSTAWETAAATEAVRHMAHDDVLVLARIYDQQRRYAMQSEQIGALIYGEIFARGTNAVIRNYPNLLSIIGTFWFRECELLVDYDRALGQLHAATGQPADVPQRCRPRSRR